MQHETDLIGDGGTTGCAIGSQLRLVPRDQVLGVSLRAIHTVVKPFGRTVIEFADDEADSKVDMRGLLNRLLAGWAAFYKLTDFTTRVFRHIDHVVFWKDGALVGPEIPQYHQVIDAKVVSGSRNGKG